MPDNNPAFSYPLAWSFPEYPKHERSVVWFIFALLIGGGLFAFALLSANYLFASIIIFIALIIALQHFRRPLTIDFSITEDGIALAGKQVPWKDIKSFWMIYEPPEIKMLYFTFKGFRPTLKIPLIDQNPLHIREALSPYVEEDLEKENESFSDAVGRMFKL
ncbi:MAG: hypothetical protein AB1352_00835 [Patescibacteria group bacterium]